MVIKQVCVKCNSFGEVEETFEIQTLSLEQYKALKEKVKEHRENELKKQQEEEKKLAKEKDKMYRMCIILAKQQFNELVEVGKADTSQEFEDMYDRFIFGEMFDESKAPSLYLSILERIR